MLSILSSSTGARRGASRREVLRAGGLGLLGLTLPDLLRGRALAEASGRTRPSSFGRAKSCLLILLKGGISHIDTFDMKPDAPAEIRGEFRPIATRVPGLRVCEHLPELARRADQFALIQSLSHTNLDHPSAAYWMTTGFEYPRAANLAGESSREDHPQYGSSVAAVERHRPGAVPPFVMLPSYLVVAGQLRSGQNAGLLGNRYDPMIPERPPHSPDFRPAHLGLEPPFSRSVLRGRRGLLEAVGRPRRALEEAAACRGFDEYQTRALDLLDSGTTREAFDIRAEPEAVRDRYGRDVFGQSVLLARRLIEAGVRLVHVNWLIPDGGTGWDTHKDNFNDLKRNLLPPVDRAVAALLDDLSALGRLDETLVVMTGEFGRTPKVNGNQAGRDHWSSAFSVFLAGAGIPGGMILGATDRQAAYPLERRVTPAELAATIFHALGIDPSTQLTTTFNRPFIICAGKPVLDLWG
jgi:hypothetical protein